MPYGKHPLPSLVGWSVLHRFTYDSHLLAGDVCFSQDFELLRTFKQITRIGYLSSICVVEVHSSSSSCTEMCAGNSDMSGYVIASHILQTMTNLVQVKVFHFRSNKRKSPTAKNHLKTHPIKGKREKKVRKVRNEFHSTANMLMTGGEKSMKQ